MDYHYVSLCTSYVAVYDEYNFSRKSELYHSYEKQADMTH